MLKSVRGITFVLQRGNAFIAANFASIPARKNLMIKYWYFAEFMPIGGTRVDN
jgi:hypothetical protein